MTQEQKARNTVKLARLKQMRKRLKQGLREHRAATAAGEAFLKQLEEQISGFEEALGDRPEVAVRD